jgi:hypothetical protein
MRWFWIFGAISFLGGCSGADRGSEDAFQTPEVTSGSGPELQVSVRPIESPALSSSSASPSHESNATEASNLALEHRAMSATGMRKKRHRHVERAETPPPLQSDDPSDGQSDPSDDEASQVQQPQDHPSTWKHQEHPSENPPDVGNG